MNTQQMVVTNLRLPYEDYIQIKTAAAEEGMSVNEYFIKIAKYAIRATGFLANVFKTSVKNDPIWDWPALAKKIKNKPMGLSAEDEIIYG